MKNARASAIAALIAACVSLPVVGVRAVDPPTTASAAKPAPKIDAGAVALLKEVQDSMAGFKTYRAHAVTHYAQGQSEDGNPQPPAAAYSEITAAKPLNLNYTQWMLPASAKAAVARPSGAPTMTMVCDGKLVWKKGSRGAAKEAYTSCEQFSFSEPWACFFNNEMSEFNNVANERKEDELVEVTLSDAPPVEGIPCRKVFVDWKPSEEPQAEIRESWYIGPDKLVHRASVEFLMAGKIATSSDTVIDAIQTNVPVENAAALFAITGPAPVKPAANPVSEALLANGVVAPDFTAVDSNGATVKLSDLKGKVVVIDFWASWCPPCKASMPHNQEVAKKLLGEKLPFVLLAVDNGEEQADFARWVKAHPELGSLRFAYVDPKTDLSGKSYHVTGIPTQYVIDAQGIIRASFVGYGGPTDDLENAVRTAASAPAKL